MTGSVYAHARVRVCVSVPVVCMGSAIVCVVMPSEPRISKVLVGCLGGSCVCRRMRMAGCHCRRPSVRRRPGVHRRFAARRSFGGAPCKRFATGSFGGAPCRRFASFGGARRRNSAGHCRRRAGGWTLRGPGQDGGGRAITPVKPDEVSQVQQAVRSQAFGIGKLPPGHFGVTSGLEGAFSWAPKGPLRGLFRAGRKFCIWDRSRPGGKTTLDHT